VIYRRRRAAYRSRVAQLLEELNAGTAHNTAVLERLIVTAKLNNVDPHAWLADTLRRINDHPARQLDELLPWNWRE
jgi:hypothetical protein